MLIQLRDVPMPAVTILCRRVRKMTKLGKAQPAIAQGAKEYPAAFSAQVTGSVESFHCNTGKAPIVPPVLIWSSRRVSQIRTPVSPRSGYCDPGDVREGPAGQIGQSQIRNSCVPE